MTARSLIQRPWQVRALLDGRRTQVRVPVKGVPHGVSPCHYSSTGWAEIEGGGGCMCSREVRCPLGGVLYVREAWRTEELGDDAVDAGLDGIRYKADGAFVGIEPTCDAADRWCTAHDLDTGRRVGRWRSPATMPRWAARIRLRVLDLRAHPVREIGEADALAEGMEFHDGHGVGHSGWRHSRDCGYVYGSARSAFASAWVQAHGRGSWDDGWCFAATVERIDEEDC